MLITRPPAGSVLFLPPAYHLITIVPYALSVCTPDTVSPVYRSVPPRSASPERPAAFPSRTGPSCSCSRCGSQLRVCRRFPHMPPKALPAPSPRSLYADKTALHTAPAAPQWSALSGIHNPAAYAFSGPPQKNAFWLARSTRLCYLSRRASQILS